ncbi:MAG: hypothetical protein ACI9OJ_000665 [Myxococcota bacterium]
MEYKTALIWLLTAAFGLVVAGCPGGSRRVTTEGEDDTGGFVQADSSPTEEDVAKPFSQCIPGQKTCQGNAQLVCNAEGTGWTEPAPCADGLVCNELGVCAGCIADASICQGSDVATCVDGTSATFVETCPEACANGFCVSCKPGLKECRLSDDHHEVWECTPTASDAADWALLTTCPDGADCVSGLCLNPCQSDIKLATNQGCDYYALDLENSADTGGTGGLSADNAQFAVIVSNPSATSELSVTVHETQLAPASQTVKVAAGELSIIELGPRNITGSVKGALAWRIKGNRPFVAYQFNPLDNVNQVFSNDASLLLPVNALGREYVVITGTGGLPFVTVIGTTNGTNVTVTPSSDTEAGSGIAATAKGESFTTSLDAGEVLNLRAQSAAGTENLTGTVVSADKDIVVFGGNVAATTGDRCCADHLEQQMFPTNVWGTTIPCTKSVARQAENDHWRIVAAEDGTAVSFSAGAASDVTLNRGQFFDVATTKDFVVTASKPVLVGQFLASSFEILPTGTYCTQNSDCASSVCSNGGSGGGRCVTTCEAANNGCSTSDYCVDNTLLSVDEAGGTCLRRPCGTDLPGCVGGNTCLDTTDLSICVGTCNAGCPSQYPECTATATFDICVAPSCFGDGDCPGGYCATFDNGSSECRTTCSPVGQCPSGQACIPPGYSADESIKVGICVDVAGCASDADCEAGHTCVIDATVPGGSCQPIGDPAFILAVPAEQFREEYVFLAPNAYKEDYVNIIGPTDVTATLDGVEVSADQWVSISGTGFKVARLSVQDGPHRIKASKPVGLVVYGYHDDVSYGYPGGANLFDLGN